jgi:hypothetical protein
MVNADDRKHSSSLPFRPVPAAPLATSVPKEARGGSIVVIHLNGAPTPPETRAAPQGIVTGRVAELRLVRGPEPLTAR